MSHTSRPNAFLENLVLMQTYTITNHTQIRSPRWRAALNGGPDLTFKKLSRGALSGWVDVLLPEVGLKIFGIALFEKDGRRWLKLPQREYESGGERKFAPVIEFDSKETNDRFPGPALAALDAFLQGGGL